jgi:hypothetical protein
LEAVKPYAGKKLIDVQTTPGHSLHLLAYATADEKATALFIVNHSARVCHAEVSDLKQKDAKVLHIAPGATDQPGLIADGALKIELAPYEVVRVTIGK